MTWNSVYACRYICLSTSNLHEGLDFQNLSFFIKSKTVNIFLAYTILFTLAILV